MEEICVEDNLDVVFKRVCSKLETLGMPVQSFDVKDEKKALVFSVNTIWALLSAKKNDVVALNQSNELVSRLKSENRRLNQVAKSAEITASNRSKDLEIVKSKLTVLEEEKQGLLSHIKLLKKECTKLQSAFETDRRVYLKNINDQKELVNSLNKNMFSTSSPRDAHSESNNVMNECVQTLDSTIQNLLGEIASVRCSFMRVYIDLNEFIEDLLTKLHPTKLPLETDKAESIFQLPHDQFIVKINQNMKLILEMLRTMY